MRQPSFAFAALPFAACAVRQREQRLGGVFRHRANQIAVIAARTGNQHQSAVGRRGTFAVQPACFAIQPDGLQEIVVHIQQARSFRIPTRQHALGNQAAVGAGKIQRGGVLRQIFGGFGRAFRQSGVSELVHMGA